MRPDVVREAVGRWPSILPALGIDAAFLTRKQGPCVFCGGKTRFTFDDKGGRGTWICTHCGAGDGISLLMKLKGVEFREAADMVRSVIGTATATPVRPERSEEALKAMLRKMWCEAKPVTRGDAADTYLRNRGVGMDEYPKVLRTHPGLDYWDGGKKAGNYPAMLALVSDANGKPVSIHRTYLLNGRKAPVESPKKLAARIGHGSAIRLYSATNTLAVCEGIGTAMAVHLGAFRNVWAAISAHGMETLVVPFGIKRVEIWADNDASYTGEAAAYALAKKLRLEGRDVCVLVPPIVDSDWLDEFVARGHSLEI